MQHKTTLARCLLILACGLLLLSSSYAQFNAADKLPVDPNVKVGKLPNGLTYYIRKNAKPEKKVQLRLVVNAGSILEDADQQGLAHMMEHMNFNGSSHFPKNDLVSYLQSIGVQFGADLNAYTGFDETVYILPIPSDDPVKVDKGFTILEDWAGNATLDTAEINKERGVVLEESRLGKGAGERMRNVYFPKLVNGSLYAQRMPIGKDDILKTFKPAALKRFYNTWYRPDLQAVVVVGDIDPAVAEQQIIKHFGHFKNPAAEKPRPAVINIPARTASEAVVATDKEQTYNILQVFNYIEKAKPVNNWGAYRESIVEGLFSAMISQRLAELTQSANPPFAFGNTGFSNFIRGYRSFTSFAFLGDKPVKGAVDALISTNEGVKKFGFLQSELDRAKIDLVNSTEKVYADRDKTESGQLVDGYVQSYLEHTPIIGISNRYQFVKQVLPTITLQEVNNLAAKMENNQGKFVLLMAPANTPQLPTNSDLLAMVNTARQLPVIEYKEKAVAKTLMDKAPTPGKVVNETTNPTLGTTDLTLSNGITITIKPTDFKNDDIQMDSWRWGGYHNYGLADKPSALFAANAVNAMGVKDMSPVDLRKFMAGKTVVVQPYINENDEGVQGGSSVKDFETFLQLLNLYFTAPRKDETLFKAMISTQKGFVKNMMDNPRAYFQDTLAKVEYQHNPWAATLNHAEDYDKIDLNKAFDIYKSIFGNAYGWHFTFVGNIDVATAKPLLEKYIGSLPTTEKDNKFTDVGVRPVKGIVNLDVKKGKEKQSIVNVIFTGETAYSNEDKLKLQAMTSLLTIKIIEKLREDMSGIYGGGMNGTIINRPYSHYAVSLSFPCGPENVDKLVNAAFDIIKKVQESGVDQKDLDKVKETMRKQNDDVMRDNEHWLDGLSYAWIEKSDPKWVLDYAGKVDALTVQDIQDAAKKYLNMQNYIKAVLYPEQ